MVGSSLSCGDRGANENELNDGYTTRDQKRTRALQVSLTACRDVSSGLNPDSSLTLMITMLVSARVPLYLSNNHSNNHKQGSQPHLVLYVVWQTAKSLLGHKVGWIFIHSFFIESNGYVKVTNLLSNIIASGICYCWQDFSTSICVFFYRHYSKFGGGGGILTKNLIRNTAKQKWLLQVQVTVLYLNIFLNIIY